MIDVTAAISSQSQFLAPGGQPPKIPFRAGESALRVLPLDANDRKAVRLDLQRSSEQVLFSEARIDRGQSDRNFLLDIVRAQPFERPAGNGDVGIRGDSLDIDDVAQPVVVRDVVAAGGRLNWKSNRLNSK